MNSQNFNSAKAYFLICLLYNTCCLNNDTFPKLFPSVRVPCYLHKVITNRNTLMNSQNFITATTYFLICLFYKISCLNNVNFTKLFPSVRVPCYFIKVIANWYTPINSQNFITATTYFFICLFYKTICFNKVNFTKFFPSVRLPC
jgi:hypothetical protein